MRNRDILLFQKAIDEWGKIVDKQTELLLNGKISEMHLLDTEEKLLSNSVLKMGDYLFQIENVKECLC